MACDVTSSSLYLGVVNGGNAGEEKSSRRECARPEAEHVVIQHCQVDEQDSKKVLLYSSTMTVTQGGETVSSQGGVM